MLLLTVLPLALATTCESSPVIADDLAAVSRAVEVRARTTPLQHVRDAEAAEALLEAGDHRAAMDAAHQVAEALRADSRTPQRLRDRLIEHMGAIYSKAKDALGAAKGGGEGTGTGGSTLDVPIISQHGSGSYPGGYCATTSLRMLLRHLGLSDPGADSVALGGARPYIPGAGSDPARLDDRARELGVSGAAFKNSGKLSDVTAMLDAGKPVMMGGEGTFRGAYEDGRAYSHTYRSSGHWMVAVGYETDAAGKVTSVILNDPDTGRRLTASTDQFLDFFAPDGNIWMITY